MSGNPHSTMQTLSGMAQAVAPPAAAVTSIIHPGSVNNSHNQLLMTLRCECASMSQHPMKTQLWNLSRYMYNETIFANSMCTCIYCQQPYTVNTSCPQFWVVYDYYLIMAHIYSIHKSLYHFKLVWIFNEHTQNCVHCTCLLLLHYFVRTAASTRLSEMDLNRFWIMCFY